MSYVIVMNGNKGLKIGRNIYDDKLVAKIRVKELKRAGHLTASVMKYNEALGLE